MALIDSCGNIHSSTTGEFTGHIRAEADAGLLATPAEPELDAEFDWVRIESLMGDNFHLDPERTAAVPKFGPDDTIAQMTRKLMTYVGKTQDMSGLSDAEIADLVDLAPCDVPMTDSERSMFGLADDARVVSAVASDGRRVFLSVDNRFKRTGRFRSRRTNEIYQAQNLSQYLVAHEFSAEFAAQHPEFDPGEVDRLFDRLADKSYTGKKYTHLWDEAYLPDGAKRVVASVLACDPASIGPGTTAETLARRIETMQPDEIRAFLAQAETSTVSVYNAAGKHDEPAYVARISHNGRSFITQFVRASEVEADLDGTTPRARRAAMNRAYRDFLEEQFQIEYDFQLQRGYIKRAAASHSATVFEQKKFVPQSHLDAAEASYFKTSGDFRHVEIDEDAELGKVGQIEAEYARLRRHLPRTPKTPALRFRKTGRHHALGVYHPHADNIAVDPRHPSAMVHEYVHHVDHTAGGRNISSSDEFRPILRQAQRAVAADDTLMSSQREYLSTPTEVLSRSGELYFHWKGYGTSLNGDGERYATEPGYTTLAPMRAEILAFWDAKLAELGADPLA